MSWFNPLSWFKSEERARELQDLRGQYAAVHKSQAVIEFDLTGKILTANDHFLDAVGYSLDEIRGQHHSMFVEPAFRQSNDYRVFWERLGRGELDAGQYKRIGKGGKEVWLQASYNPIFDQAGKPFKVVKYATDITADVEARDTANRMKRAIDNVAVAVMMIDRDFMVTYANDTTRKMLRDNAEQFRKIWPNFDAEKILGSCIDMFHKNPSHQRQMLADPSRLPYKTEINVGELRFALHVTASYDARGNYCGNTLEWADISDAHAKALQNAEYVGMFEAINKAQAVIEFDLTGKILNANRNFLDAVGYTLAEIVGQHHSMFIDAAERTSPEYRQFWEKLGRGEFDAGQYRRVARGGRELWLQASYNPILDLKGKPFKVVKYATDVTGQVNAARILQEAVKQTQEVVAAAKGNDLTMRIPLEGKTGEILDLCSGVNGLIDTMATVVTDILGVSANISSAVSEITSGTNDLSQRTEMQASSLEETSSSMEEIAQTIRQNADNAQQANQLAINARSVASDGGQVVAKAVDAMSKIESSSRKISDIIGVIDEIAFQTNLLALNAAVEAARAGDAGRGFAVVASEVRSLAQRSSEAAKDIKALIVESGGQVRDGVTLVNNAGSSLQEIVDSVKRVTDIVSEIAAASKEQSVGVEEINKAVSQMDEMTQQNSALVEENAAACRMLQQQAEDMYGRMAAYTVDEDQVADAAPAPAPAAVVREMPRKAAAPAPKAKPARQAQPVKKVANAGRSSGAARLQADLTAAFDSDSDWKEF